jgi:hypothetical protein
VVRAGVSRAIALYDHAAALGRAYQVERGLIESPARRPEAADGLRTIASELDGNV